MIGLKLGWSLRQRGSETTKYTFVHKRGTKALQLRGVLVGGWENIMEELVVLVVDDDQEIQGLVEAALTEAGFEPAVATSGEEAVTLLKGNKATYRALVTDINLRGQMDGWEVARQARQIDPAFPVLYMTGASANQWAVCGVPNSILLTKPFAPAQLVTALSQVLSTRSRPTAPT